MEKNNRGIYSKKLLHAQNLSLLCYHVLLLQLLYTRQSSPRSSHIGQPCTVRQYRGHTHTFRLVDLPVGDKDLQQCADAIIRMRTEYFFNQNQQDKISFTATDGTILSFAQWLRGTRYQLKGSRLITMQTSPSSTNQRGQLEAFLEVVFSYCGTYSLGRELVAVYDINDMQPGDFFIKPRLQRGHALIVTGVAVNSKGEKIFMLAQGFMPAKDIHIVKNPANDLLNPWYKAGEPLIVTLAWTFEKHQLKRWAP